MMGRLKREQKQLFYSFCLDDAVPDDHAVRAIAAVLDLSWVHGELAQHYSHLGRPSVDPVLMIRMLIVGYVFAIRSERALWTFSREDFRFDKERNAYICPANKILTTTGTVIDDGETLRYLASTSDCRGCPLKTRCCPNASFRRIPRSIYEEARDVARALAKTDAFEQSRHERKRVEMLFAHLKRILRLGRLRLRGSRGAQDEFTLAAIAQNLRRLAKLVVRPPPAVFPCAA